MTNNTETQMSKTHYIVQTAAANMPNSCWGRYGRVAVLEVDSGLDSVSMISARARGCRRVVETWERRHIGSTDRSAFFRALAEAEALAAELNQPPSK
jgi:hypothetical protein